MNIATFLETKLDEVLGIYINGTSAAVSAYAGGIAAVALSIYFIFQAYAAIRGDLTEPMSKITKDLMKIALVLTVALGGGAYQEYVISFVNGITSDLASVVTHGAAKTVGGAIDYANSGCVVLPSKAKCVSYDSVFLDLAIENKNYFGIPDPLYAFVFVIIAIAQLVITVLCIMPVILSKIGMALMLGLGPVFVLLAIFPVTNKYFEAWVSAVIGFVLTQVLVAAICSVVPEIFQGLLKNAVEQGAVGDATVLTDALAILIAAIGLGLSALHASQKGAQLAGGGMSMDSKGIGGMIMQSVMNRLIQGPSGGGAPGGGKPDSSGNENSASSSPSKAYSAGQAIGRAPYNAGKTVGNILNALDKKRGK
jgi:type IV secretion system protein VirB6